MHKSNLTKSKWLSVNRPELTNQSATLPENDAVGKGREERVCEQRHVHTLNCIQNVMEGNNDDNEDDEGI